MGSRNNKPGRIVKGTAKQPTLKDASGIWSLDEAMQAHRVNAWPQPNLFQPVSNSLRFKYNANGGGLLLKNNSRGGDQRKWTYSCWVKRSLLTSATSDDFELFGAGWNNSYYGLHVNFQTANDVIQVYDWGPSGGGAFAVVTTPVFRDTSAWYHVVCSVDTTQATNTNRIKIWVNGVQVSIVNNASNNWGASGGFPNQGYATPANGPGLQHYVGATFVASSNAKQLDGYLSEVNFIDGAQLQPTLFGQFDTNNTWVPIPYTGSYGTNGFYLPFTNATTSQTLGYDASLNGTTTYNADQDPYRASVALHLTGNGPAGGQNNVFADSSPNNLAITRNGTPTQGSFSPYPLNTNAPYNPATHGASGYFDGSSYLSVTQPAISSSADFTMEMWAYPTSISANTGLYSAAASRLGLIYLGNGGPYWLGASPGDVSSSGGAMKANSWQHIAVSRQSGTLRIFYNGALVGSGANTDAISSATWYVGSDTAGEKFPGFISNLRVTNSAVYTAAFTPTNRPFGTLTNNTLNFSEDFTNYTQLNTNIVSNAGIAPDSTPSATKLNANVSSSNKVMYYGGALTAGTYTASIYAKAGELQGLAFATGTVGMFVNLATGTYRSAYSSTPTSYAITPVGNGWYRCSFTFTLAATNSLYIGPNDNVDNNLGSGIIGTGSNGIYVWGAQLENGSTLSNYIPTPANFSTAPSLLLNFANAAVVDSTGSQNLLTASGATITSASKYGSGALTFNGSTDYISISNITPFTFTGNFTIELWGRTTSSAATGGVYPTFFETSAFNSTGIGVKVVGGASQACLWYNGVQILTGTSSVIDGVWHHIAVTRLGATMNLFVDGQLQSQYSSTATFTPVTVSVGGEYTGSAWQGFLNGQVDDLRVTNGVARYQAAFTPPARALPETGGKSFATVNVNAGVVKTFTTTGTTSWTAPTDVTSVEVLVVAGGGAGGNNHAGGGGGGGLIYNNQYPVTPGQTYTITVGSGGLASGTGANNNTNGGNSQFGALTAIGGGAGGNRNDTAGTSPGQNGGSGGGGGGAQAPYAGCYVAGLGTAGQGFSGGVAVDTLGGGGGGAGGVGAAGAGTRVGGNGLQFGISGTPQYYAGGGGGSNGSAPAAAGGLGGGGTSGTTIGSNGTAGTANTGGGGGGGGAGNTTGSNGGSGIVLIRYTTQAVGNTSDATTDNLVDSPTLYGHDTGAGGEVVGNYCTINPLNGASSTVVPSNGNLTVTWGNSQGNATIGSTIPVNSGRWYFEATLTTVGGSFPFVGIIPAQNVVGSTTSEAGYTNTVWVGNGQLAAGDIIGFAFNLDTLVASVYKNGVALSTGSAWNTSAIASGQGYWMPAVSGLTGTVWNLNFGQRAWAYAPPAGFNALTTKNLPRATLGTPAAAPNQFFDVVTYAGNSSSQTISTLNFQPDLIWIKSRSNSYSHWIGDSVRGFNVRLYSDGAAAEAANPNGGVTTVSSTGFTVSAGAETNNTSNNYVAWCWKAGGTAVSNTSGTITSQVSANTTSGFSVVTYTGNATNSQTVGHGLGATPSMIIWKNRDAATQWGVYHTSLGTSQYLVLNTNTGPATYSGYTAVNSSTFQIANDSWFNGSTNKIVAYCWTQIPGFSQFGTYTGNGSTDGTFIYTGFKPAWIMIKNITTGVQGWNISDSARSPYNLVGNSLSPPSSQADNTGGSPSYSAMDFVSNGIKLRGTDTFTNGSANNYIYAVFAANPFGNTNGTAR